MIIKNARVIGETFQIERADVRFRDTILEIGPSLSDDGETAIDASGLYLIPGLIDVHTHGAVGQDSTDPDCDFAAWKRYLLKNGVTTFYPTTTTVAPDRLLRALENLKDADGINMEGPFLSVKKKGAHDETKIREVDLELMDRVKDRVKITTVAPEMNGNLDRIGDVVRMGVRVSLGHTAADYETCRKAFEAGATQATHMFNAMNPLHHREPGLIGAAVEDDRVFCEVISDGFHLHPSAVRLLYRALGPDRMVLISDALSAAGLADGAYKTGEMNVVVRDGQARLADGTIAGSTTNLMGMVRKCVSFGVPLTDAVKMATLTPARALGTDIDRGSISVGKRADLALLDEKLEIHGVFYRGESV